MKQSNSKELKLGNICVSPGSKKKFKRVGRGHSSGVGKTCGRGHKGQKSRSGGVKRPGFEGGQTPLYRRLPKINKFSNYLFKKTFEVVNLSDLKKLKGEVTPQILVDAGLVRYGELVKVLGDGDISHSLSITAHAFSKSAIKKIEAAGGKALKI